MRAACRNCASYCVPPTRRTRQIDRSWCGAFASAGASTCLFSDSANPLGGSDNSVGVAADGADRVQVGPQVFQAGYRDGGFRLRTALGLGVRLDLTHTLQCDLLKAPGVLVFVHVLDHALEYGNLVFLGGGIQHAGDRYQLFTRSGVDAALYRLDGFVEAAPGLLDRSGFGTALDRLGKRGEFGVERR